MNPEQDRGGIFLNYRQRDIDNDLRDHALFVDALSRRLARHFGKDMVFVDTTINPGVRYPDELRAKLVSCHVLLSVIHPEWAADLHQRQHRPGPDWVRYELGVALNGSPSTGNRTTPLPVVIPILLNDSALPSADELPDEIRDLADLTPFRLRAGALIDDLTCLLDEIERRIPVPWEPPPAGETKQSKYSSLGLISGLVAVLVVFQALTREPTEGLFGLLAFSTLGMFAVFLGTVASWAIKRVSYRAERRLQTQPAGQSLLVIGLSFIGVLLILYSALLSTIREDPVKTTISTAMIFLAGSSGMIFLIMSYAERDRRRDREWPPSVPTGPETARTVWLRRAALRLDGQLTASWHPPLSRIQRDQARHIVRQLSTAVTVLRAEARRSRPEWLRAEHPVAALMYAAWLAGTVAVAIVLIDILPDAEYGDTALFRISLAPVAVIVLCFGSAELWFRQQRGEKTRLAAEITESLHTRLLPLLPPAPVTGTVRDRTAAPPYVEQESPLR